MPKPWHFDTLCNKENMIKFYSENEFIINKFIDDTGVAGKNNLFIE